MESMKPVTFVADSPGNSFGDHQCQVDNCIFSTALRRARRRVKLADLNKPKPYQLDLTNSKLKLGDYLGEGHFCDIFEVRSLDLAKTFVIKFLNPERTQDPSDLRSGTTSLALELRLLSFLRHPNIIRLRGTARPTNLQIPHFCGFGLILDRMQDDTLENKIEKWSTSNKSRIKIWNRKVKNAEKSMLNERLKVAFDIACAFDYLHEKNVIHRDLKPENVGFDIDGNVKVFDFGLASVPDAEEKLPDGTYKLSGHTGTRRYMAPEIVKSLPYNHSVDIYSFGILLWEMCALQQPFEDYSLREHTISVVNGGERPKLCKSWSSNLRNLIDAAWSGSHQSRPSFKVIKARLADEIIWSKSKSKDFELHEQSQPKTKLSALAA